MTCIPFYMCSQCKFILPKEMYPTEKPIEGKERSGQLCPRCKKGTLGECWAHIQDRDEKLVELPHLH